MRAPPARLAEDCSFRAVACGLRCGPRPRRPGVACAASPGTEGAGPGQSPPADTCTVPGVRRACVGAPPRPADRARAPLLACAAARPGAQAPRHRRVSHVDMSTPRLPPGLTRNISAWTPPCLSKCSAGGGRSGQTVPSDRRTPGGERRGLRRPWGTGRRGGGAGCGWPAPPCSCCWVGVGLRRPPGEGPGYRDGAVQR